MTNQLSPVVLASVVLAGGLAMRAVPGPFGWLQTLTGIVLLIILFAYDGDDQRTAAQSCAFAAICGFCLMLASSGFLARWASQPGTVQVAVPGGWLPVVWVGGAVAFFFIDSIRMGNRGKIQTPASFAGAHRPATMPTGTEAIPPFAPTPSAQQMPPEPAPFNPTMRPRTEPPVQPQPQPDMIANPPEPASIPPIAPVTPAAAAPVSGPPPKVVGIYVNLLGEGLNMMRAVAAQDLGRGYYLIVEPAPEGETWQFQTGQVVRCQKKSLASGKHMVAVEEAQRA